MKPRLSDCYSRDVQSEVVGIRHAPDREKQMRSRLAWAALLAAQAHGQPLGFALQRDALGVQPQLDAFVSQEGLDLERHILVLAGEDTRSHSTTVTRLPNRRNICANSSPT
jgi:hypothetical protein